MKPIAAVCFFLLMLICTTVGCTKKAETPVVIPPMPTDGPKAGTSGSVELQPPGK